MDAPRKPLFVRLRDWSSPAIQLADNAISLIGVVFVTTATILWVFLLPTLVRADTTNPYVGIPAFLLLPGVFIAGLVLIPLGIHFRRSRRLRQGLDDAALSQLDLKSPGLRRLLAFIAAASVANLIIVAQWGYSAVNYMDSSAFCGLACHTVMQPEYTAYIASAHASVDCVACHIGPGAAWFVKAKFSGLGRLVAVARNNYPRPVPSPVENMRAARETCEHCHWPGRFSGQRMVVRPSYASGEQNQRALTVLLMKVGGSTSRGNVGIHGVHLDQSARMVYTSLDRQRQVIPRITYTAPDGKVTVFNSTDTKVTPQELARGETRAMDCLDCHNRPAHAQQTPDRALDEALIGGRIDPTLPFVKRESLAALTATYKDRDQASHEIDSRLTGFYKSAYPDVFRNRSADVQGASAAVQAIYARNIFPEMNITWGTYPSNLGHMDSPGCFRCHDGNHVSADGRSIPNDCSTCHDIPVMQEQDPKVLSDLGYDLGPARK